jgi:arginase family enzyme
MIAASRRPGRWPRRPSPSSGRWDWRRSRWALERIATQQQIAAVDLAEVWFVD